MLFERSQRSRFECVASYGWADSSPQGGRDWLFTRLASHRWNPQEPQARPGIVGLFKRASLLSCAGSEGQRREEADPAGLELRNNAISILRENLNIRVLPPAALGLRRANLAHKAAAFVHSVALETNQRIECVQAEMSSLVSFTTDMGTEAGIHDFRCINLLELMPSWMRQPNEVRELDLAANADEPADTLPEAMIEVDEQAVAEAGADILPDCAEEVTSSCGHSRTTAICSAEPVILQPVSFMKFVAGLLQCLTRRTGFFPMLATLEGAAKTTERPIVQQVSPSFDCSDLLESSSELPCFGSAQGLWQALAFPS